MSEEPDSAYSLTDDNERRFRFLLERMENIPIQGYDENRRVIYWNSASERVYGYSWDEAYGRQLEDLIIPQGMRNQVVAATSAWYHGGAPIPSEELTLRDKHGNPVQVFSSHCMYTNLDGKKEMYCIDIDLRDRYRTEAVLREAKEEAERANRAKSDFIATMSHEIRTPLNGVIGMSDYMRMLDLNSEQRECADIIFQSGNILLSLINDILDFSKIEAGKMEVHLSKVDLIEEMEQLAELMRVRALEKSIDLTAHIELSERFHYLDVTKLKQVLVNLLGNAIKFTAEQGRILLDVHAEAQERIHFSVTDTGIGISKDNIAKLFQPFTQIDGSFTRKYGGTGLGLSICERLVELMGGGISVISEPGVGSTFAFWLPIKARRNPHQSESDRDGEHAGNHLPAAKDGKRTLCALVVDDEDSNRQVIGAFLRKEGACVYYAEDGESALEQVRQLRPHLVFMDLSMPRLTGLEATARIRAELDGTGEEPIYIIAFTAAVFDEDRHRCLKAGMNDFLPKPITRLSFNAVFNRFRQSAQQAALNFRNGHP